MGACTLEWEICQEVNGVWLVFNKNNFKNWDSHCKVLSNGNYFVCWITSNILNRRKKSCSFKWKYVLFWHISLRNTEISYLKWINISVLIESFCKINMFTLPFLKKKRTQIPLLIRKSFFLGVVHVGLGTESWIHHYNIIQNIVTALKILCALPSYLYLHKPLVITVLFMSP